MCELFGVTANKKIVINQWLKDFFSHSKDHPNGWGLAFFDDGNVHVEKEPLQALKSNYLKCRLKEKIQTSIFLAHIRRATIGDDSYSNSHPFVATDNTGRAWTLIHNGTIFDAPQLSIYLHHQKGSTDSERILLYLIDQINDLNNKSQGILKAKERFKAVENTIKKLAPENKLNLLIYDDEYLYVHMNAAGTLFVNEKPGISAFSTHPLDDEIWKEVSQNRLLVYKEGSLVYEGIPHNHSYIDDPEKLKLIFMDYAQL
ncbi:glutamine amidotransferase [Acetitomaculum ruminis DSM 5522]|uniref:Glutamine amidotransferase n=1 Tax=Acetitomaculum ruminis DSM 5522 TaxID=1120918 RepID=A0A1I0ZYP5_9FIRM|nr:class II glutamine amidotransferase [Acetitomaculum ruminis]SFB30824.1 glutamine amidotransferase [Acetitomaculum ruminis DSM 5522]